MGLFGPRPLPRTSYGYSPPLGATARGWVCTSGDCGTSQHEQVRRWPKACTSCGAAADPLFDGPWKHEAEGVEVQALLREDPMRDGGFQADRWVVWRFRDAVLRGDRAATAETRASARSHTAQRMADSWWAPRDPTDHD